MRLNGIYGAVALLPLALAACHASTETQSVDSNTVSNGDAMVTTTTTTTTVDGNTTSNTTKSVTPVPIPVPSSAPTGTPTPAPAPPPPVTGDNDGKSPQAAVNTVDRYYADINNGRYRAAYGLWDNNGQASHQSFREFRNGFAGTASTDVATGTPGDAEGAAGSIYIKVPVTVHAKLKDGTRQRFRGSYTLRRVNDVPGSTAEQRRWHLYSADLRKG